MYIYIYIYIYMCILSWTKCKMRALSAAKNGAEPVKNALLIPRGFSQHCLAHQGGVDGYRMSLLYLTYHASFSYEIVNVTILRLYVILYMSCYILVYNNANSLSLSIYIYICIYIYI